LVVIVSCLVKQAPELDLRGFLDVKWFIICTLNAHHHIDGAVGSNCSNLKWICSRDEGCKLLQNAVKVIGLSPNHAVYSEEFYTGILSIWIAGEKFAFHKISYLLLFVLRPVENFNLYP
jgi:hypothetical protein